jgi:carboxypeptidase Taq
MKAYENLVSVFRQLAHLRHASAICHWDEAVMMPPGGGQARAEALASLHALKHELLVNPQNQQWIEEAKNLGLASPWQQANLQWMETQYLQASCLPTDLVQRSELAFIRCEQAWRTLRAENNWREFLPLLSTNVALIREAAQIKAEVFGISPYDSLIGYFSPGLSQAIIDPVFAQLQAFLPDFIQQVTAKQVSPQSIAGHFPIEKQRQLGLQLMRAIGFDFNHGRLDVSHHPFCGGVPQDVRITTRYTESEFISASMGVCHETGHALYERGLPAEWLDQPVGEALGMAMHESQSLLIEMQACRSLEFIRYLSTLVTNGVMQDVHWPSGAFGYFPAYTIGAIIAAQLYQAALKHRPQIPAELSQGNFKNLVEWLRMNVHRHGRLLSMNDLLTQATGGPLNVDYFINHLRTRYQ